MRKMIEMAALRLSLCLGVLSLATQAHAQDPEEGAVDLNETSSPAAEPAKGAPAWETPPSEGGSPREDEEPESESSAPRQGPGNLRVFLGARIGVGGGFRPKDTDVSYVANPTPGMQLGADYVLHKFFALGLETRLSFSSVKANDYKYMLWDLVLKPRVQYRIKPFPIEIYFAVPGGLSLSVPDQEFNTPDGRVLKEKGKVGATVGLYAGATYFFNDRWALNAELGWSWTFIRYENWRRQSAMVPGVPDAFLKGEAKVTLGQLTLLALNLTYAF